MQTHDPRRNIQLMAELGLELAGAQEVAEAHALVERLVSPPIADVSVCQAVQRHTQASIYVIREAGRIAGVLGDLPLVQGGLRAIESADFSGANPNLDHVARPGDVVSAFYFWGYAAEGRRTSALAVKALIVARDVIYPDLPFFSRASKPLNAGPGEESSGWRIGPRRFGCVAYPGQPTLLYSPRSIAPGRAAA